MINVAIIDYKMGNLFSVFHACENVGLNPKISSDPKILKESDAAILPGVGAFGEAMETLEKLDLIKPIKEYIDTGKSFMGICLGFQLLFSESEEFGLHKGLGIFEGMVKKFSITSINGGNVKIPQIGWNQIYNYGNSWELSPLVGIDEGEYMYFVHSYYVEPVDDKIKMTKTIYECFEYCSSINKGNVFATQFHPEKSAKEGLKIYKNWARQINNRG